MGMIYFPSQQVELRYRPSYVEIADPSVSQRYQTTERELIDSRESSDYVRRKIAQLEAEKKLKQLLLLPENWDSYGSERPSTTAIAAAGSIAVAFIEFGLIPDAITPSSEGGIAICFVRNQKYADVECFNSGQVIAVRYSTNDDPKAWPAADPIARAATIMELSAYLSA